MLFDLDKKDTLIIIPARGGSQRVPNKNLRMLYNQPLIVHSICLAPLIIPSIEFAVAKPRSL